MSNVLHRTTKQYIRSVNTPDYPESDWVINPVIPDECWGYFSYYWDVVGDKVSLMSKADRDALDAAAKSADDAIKKTQAEGVADSVKVVPTPLDKLTLDERVRALEKAVFGL